MAQADARARMTGRIIDSYTNIQTIKLFAHAIREHDYAREAMGGFIGTVHRQMRLVTLLTVAPQTANAMLLSGAAGLPTFARQHAAISLGSLAVAIAFVVLLPSPSDQSLYTHTRRFVHLRT